MQAIYELSGFHSASGAGSVDSWYGLYGTMYASSKGTGLRDCAIRSAAIVFPVCSNDGGVILRVTRGGVLMETGELPGRQNAPLTAALSGASLVAFAAAQGKVAIQVFVHNGDKTKFFKTRRDEARIVVDYVPHTSGLTLSSGTVAAGGSVTATIGAHDKTFAHEIRLTLGQRLNIQRIDPGVGSAQVTVPMEWLDQLPHASTGAATVTLETLSGTQVLGKVSQPLTVTVPASAAPTFTASCAPLLSVGGVTYPSMGAGVYVQGKSGCTAQITGAAAKYGADVASYSIRGGGYAGTAAVLATGLLTQAGAVPFVFRVTDTRGLVTEKTVNITVKPYAPPQVTELRGWRVNDAGAASLSGTRGMVRSVWGFSALDGANTCTAAVYLRPGMEAEKPLNAAMVSGETYPVADASGSLTLPLTVTYTLRLVLTDRYGAVERTATLPSANFAMHFNAKGNSVAFGKACEHENAFEIAQGRNVYLGDQTLDEHIQGQVQTATMKAWLRDTFYPVGSIYMSVNGTSPATLFGGKWEQLKDRFLVGAGSTYAAGETGGWNFVYLTQAQLPAHTHTMTLARKDGSPASWSTASAFGRYSGDAGGASFTMTTGSVGSGGAVENRPPYLAVYMWKRTG